MFKNTQGKWLTKALFFEYTTPQSREWAIFTNKDEDIERKGKLYRSLKKLFLQCPDPTEYDFATNHLGGWGHWKDMQAVPEIQPLVQEWREERDVMVRSQGVKTLIGLAKEGDRTSAKWLSDKGWLEKSEKGRPSNQQVEKAAKQQAEIKNRFKADLELINGSKG